MSSFKVPVVSINTVEDHPNADRLSIVTLNGLAWVVVTAKDQECNHRYKKGDLCIYVPIDSCITNDTLYQFLFPEGSKITLSADRRIKSIRIRGSLSQGMIIDLHQDLIKLFPKLSHVKEGDDVSTILGVTKFEPVGPPASFSGVQIKSPPEFNKYTDIENFKNFPNVFSENDFVDVTSKLHGTAARMYKKKLSLKDKLLGFIRLKKPQDFFVGSRNHVLKHDGKSVYSKVALSIEPKLKPGEMVFGEIVGQGIQKNYSYGHNSPAFYAYDVKIDGRYLTPLEFRDWCSEREINAVPHLYRGPFDLKLIDHLRSGDEKTLPQKIREGVVIKSDTDQNSPIIGRKVLKFINDEFLLKNNTDWH